ncbi:unnamed protein product [Symbiodinium sp. CCMP2592]|nr:unnamed protein product [Symbiodinium sp. CCMP2592]
MAEPPRGSFAELVALAQRAGHIDALAAAGVLLAAPPPPAVVTDLALVSSAQDPGRPDVPRRRVPLRANLRAALDALLPANRKRSVEELRDGYLAETSKGPYASRLKTWMALSYQGKVDPWPVSADTIEALGAAFKKGGYRSAKEYFLAAFRHQEHDLGLEVSPVLRRLAKRAVKSIVRGLPGTRLKEAFPLADLGALVTYRCDLAFDPAAVPHATDVLVLATWFMLREIEIAGALVGDVVLTKHVAERNKMLKLLPQSDDLFGSDQQLSSSSSKKRKASQQAEQEKEHVDINIGDGRTVCVRACTKKSEDVQVLLEPEALDVVFSYLTSEPFEFQAATRSYVRSGKFKKDKKNQPSEDSENAED